MVTAKYAGVGTKKALGWLHVISHFMNRGQGLVLWGTL